MAATGVLFGVEQRTDDNLGSWGGVSNGSG